MSLFQRGNFALHSGQESGYKIDCDFLTDEDLDTIAEMLSKRLRGFWRVEGVPQGGLRLAAAMKKYCTPYQPIRSDKILIVDDVFTTGASMEKYREGVQHPIGAVIFARSDTPEWITPLFKLEPEFKWLHRNEQVPRSKDSEYERMYHLQAQARNIGLCGAQIGYFGVCDLPIDHEPPVPGMWDHSEQIHPGNG